MIQFYQLESDITVEPKLGTMKNGKNALNYTGVEIGISLFRIIGSKDEKISNRKSPQKKKL